MTVETLAAHWSRVLLRPSLPAAAVVVAAGHPAALLVPFASAVRACQARQVGDLPTFTAAAGRDVLLDLIYRAQRLGAPTGITCHTGPTVAIVPLSWATDVTVTGQAAPSPTREEITR
jgi:antitoxin (DNA-binding transcriptional repressor) of toxin-antitoxin stability system